MKKDSLTFKSTKPQREEFGNPYVDSEAEVTAEATTQPEPPVSSAGSDLVGGPTINYRQLIDQAQQILVSSDWPWSKVSRLKKLFQIK